MVKEVKNGDSGSQRDSGTLETNCILVRNGAMELK
jgi:hypothetical protein